MVDYVRYWSDKTEIKAAKMINWIGIARSKFYGWHCRYGKVERYHKTIKGTCIRVKTPLSLKDAQIIVSDFVAHYNNKRLPSAIGYITPSDKLEGRAETILATREAKLTAAREARKARRNALCKVTA